MWTQYYTSDITPLKNYVRKFYLCFIIIKLVIKDKGLCSVITVKPYFIAYSSYLEICLTINLSISFQFLYTFDKIAIF